MTYWEPTPQINCPPDRVEELIKRYDSTQQNYNTSCVWLYQQQISSDNELRRLEVKVGELTNQVNYLTSLVSQLCEWKVDKISIRHEWDRLREYNEFTGKYLD